jgi:WD repeat-containing protein mio
MDRPEPGLIRWSPDPRRNSFLHVNLQHSVVRLYEPIGHAQRGRFNYQKLSLHDDFPPLTTWDWSPASPGLVAVGTSNGVVNLLRVDDDANSYLELPLKMARTSQAVAFNTAGQLAVGLDRVRNDSCLYVWDVERLGNFRGKRTGFPDVSLAEPVAKLEPSVSVSSIRFFEDNPKTLVIGIRQQGLRIHDLRGEAQLLLAICFSLWTAC